MTMIKSDVDKKLDATSYDFTNYFKPMSEGEFLDSLEKSRKQVLEGNVIEANELLNEIKEKYGI